MNEQDLKNFETFLANSLAHQVAIGTALAIAALAHPNAREILDAFERDLLSSSIPQLANAGVPATLAAQYRAELSNVFNRARGQLEQKAV